MYSAHFYIKKGKTMATNDQRIFTRTAMSTKKINIAPKLMRGGTRL